MSIKTIKILSIMTLISLFSCNKKYEYKACFTTEKELYSVGEEIVFNNCSTYKGEKKGYKYGVQWIMGDGQVRGSFNNDPITYVFNYPGEYVVKLKIGKKEGPTDETEKLITIVE